MEGYVVNPKTSRPCKIGSKTHRRLIKAGALPTVSGLRMNKVKKVRVPDTIPEEEDDEEDSENVRWRLYLYGKEPLFKGLSDSDFGALYHKLKREFHQ